MQRPSLYYRATGRVNRVVWRMPLPHRVLARLSRIAYRNPPMPLSSVLSVLDALDAAGIRCWLWGGWGVDALAGKQRRVHRDLDLVLAESELLAASDTLAPLGYNEWYRIDSERPLHRRVVLHDHELAGRAIDLHPVDFGRHPLTFAEGRLDGRAIPCLSPELQLSTRVGYRSRRHDRFDMATLRRFLTRPASALIVPVPAATELLHESAHERGMPAHVTLVYPFLPASQIDAVTERMLADVFADIAPFQFSLARIEQFPGVHYLAPDPADAFVELTERVVALWPEHQPYGGAFDRVIPHLTVAYGDTVPEELKQALPISSNANEVWLMTRTPGAWVPRARFALGAVATTA